MARHVYIISYDIVADKRRNRVYAALRGWGDHLQYSVFRLILTTREVIEVRTDLAPLINTQEDQILFFNLGPYDGRALDAITALGVDYEHPERHVYVV